MKNEKEENIAWLIDKELKDIKFELWGLPIGLNHFYRIYIWYILFTILILIMLFLTRKKYGRFMYKYIVIGYLFALCIAYLSDIVDNQEWIYLYIDKDGNKQAFRQKKFREQGTGVLSNGQVILKGGKNLKDKNEAVYIFKSTKKMDNFIKKNNIQTINFRKYVFENQPSSNNSNWKEKQAVRKWGELDVFWKSIQLHVKTTFSIIITFMLIVAAWNKKIFFELMPWFIVILALESIVGITWRYYYSLSMRNNVLFYIRKLQSLVSLLSIVTFFLFFGYSQKK